MAMTDTQLRPGDVIQMVSDAYDITIAGAVGVVEKLADRGAGAVVRFVTATCFHPNPDYGRSPILVFRVRARFCEKIDPAGLPPPIRAELVRAKFEMCQPIDIC